MWSTSLGALFALLPTMVLVACGAEQTPSVTDAPRTAASTATVPMIRSRSEAGADDCPVGKAWRVDGGFGRCGLDLSLVGEDGGGRAEGAE
jgi:hypothetical protein